MQWLTERAAKIPGGRGSNITSAKNAEGPSQDIHTLVLRHPPPPIFDMEVIIPWSTVIRAIVKFRSALLGAVLCLERRRKNPGIMKHRHMSLFPFICLSGFLILSAGKPAFPERLHWRLKVQSQRDTTQACM